MLPLSAVTNVFVIDSSSQIPDTASLSMAGLVNNIVNKANFQLNIGQGLKYLTYPSAQQLVQSLVISSLHHWNNFLCGVTSELLYQN